MHPTQITRTPRGCKPKLQRMAVGTQYPPFLWIYRFVYALAVRLCTRRLKRIPGVRSIYLRRGLAGARPLYGLSDIDLMVMVDGELSGRVAARVRHQYDLLCRVIPMLPEPAELGVYNREYFHLLYESTPFYRGRFDQGRCGWRRLYGEDIFRELPPPRNDASRIAWQELRPAWNYLALELVSVPVDGSEGKERPSFVRRYIAYKAIAEAARACLIARGEDPTITREHAVVRAALTFPEIAETLNEVHRLRKNLLGGKAPDPDTLLHVFLSLARQTLAASTEPAAKNIKLRIQAPPSLPGELPLSKEVLALIENAAAGLHGIDRCVFLPRLSFDAVATLDLDPVELAGATTDAWNLVLVGRTLPFAQEWQRFHHQVAALQPFVNTYFCDGELMVATRPVKGGAILDARQAPEVFASLRSARPLCGRLEIADAVEVERPFDAENPLELRARMLLELFNKSEAYQLPVRSFFALFWEAGRAYTLAAQAGSPLIDVPVVATQIIEALARHTPAEESVLRRIHAEYWKEARGEISEAARYMVWAGCYAQMLHEQLCTPGAHTIELPAEARARLTISVNIITRNRAAFLKEALQSLVEQERAPDQVVIVDNASTDETKAVANSFADRLNITVIREERVGIPIARNTALAHSTGDIIALLDDDCVADRRWLAEIELPFLRDPHIAAVGGKVTPVGDRPELVARFYDDRMRGSRRRAGRRAR